MGMRLVAGDPKPKLVPVDISEQKYWLPLHESRVLDQKKQRLIESIEHSVEDLHLKVSLDEFRSTIQGRPVLFVANHQTAMESLAFCILGAYLVEHPVSGVAKEEHRNTDFGHFIENSIDPNSSYRPLIYVERESPNALLNMKKLFIQHLCSKQSLLLHVDGTRAMSAGQGIQNISGMWFDIAEESGALVIPVGFSGGIDAWEKDKRDNPRYRQHIVVGMPLDIIGLTMRQKKEIVQKSIEILYVPSLGKKNSIAN
jgi:1-acyl-sn-glycerol-3-phosphate acyltransferase